MVAATPPLAGAAGATKPPASIEDFLWNIHSVLCATPGPLHLDNLKDAYLKHLGHKCAVERFLVVGEGGLAATLKRIPHVVSLFQEGSVTCVKATQKSDSTREDLIEADQQYRRDLIKKNAMAKAKAKGATPGAAAAKAPAAAATTPAAAPAKRPAEEAAGAPAKQAKTGEADSDTLARMLVQGVVRVLQNRSKNGKGALPLNDLEEEFKALWKVPFNLQQAGETDAEAFLGKWPHKVELVVENGTRCVQLPKKTGDKPKAPEGAAAAKAAAAPAAAAAEPAAAAENNGDAGKPAIAKRAGGPTRPPATIEDFLWNIHQVLEAYGKPLPVDLLRDVYSQHLGHKCAIERFLVVGEGGLGATLKRIPHIVTVANEADGTVLKTTLPAAITREQLLAADQAYRKQLQQKNLAAKAAAAAKAPAAAPAAAAPAAAAAAPEKPAAAEAPATAEPVKEPEAKKPRPEDTEMLGKMLIQGIVRVLQNRAKEGKGALPLANLEEEFKALWNVPFNLAQAGESDAVVFLSKWPNKVEVVTTDGAATAVQLSKKKAGAVAAAEKAAGVPAAAKSAPATAAAPPATTGNATADSAASTADKEAMQSLPEIQREARAMLQAMQDMARRQEAFVEMLSRLGAK
eukprot:TRINITY_DN81455_c0_g1_i1.p1 TRINITY_DN81455_c0_g1~~TRINITY_DN81455_c0_g1_i1.p1  ORF type:complete len:631 (-),score=213.00 TRINITY_DN81455_c0_g1_i1:273-2165(-)